MGQERLDELREKHYTDTHVKLGVEQEEMDGLVSSKTRDRKKDEIPMCMCKTESRENEEMKWKGV